jgi:ribosome-associated heat shock protein Hsp15
MNDPAAPRQRIDKWLWFARIVKSRTLAAKLVTEGRIRVNSLRIETAAKSVGPGDVLTIALERDVKVLRILANGERRGPYSEARLLYDDLTGRESPG